MIKIQITANAYEVLLVLDIQKINKVNKLLQKLMEIIHTINYGDKVKTKISFKANKSVLQVTVRRKTAV